MKIFIKGLLTWIVILVNIQEIGSMVVLFQDGFNNNRRWMQIWIYLQRNFLLILCFGYISRKRLIFGRIFTINYILYLRYNMLALLYQGTSSVANDLCPRIEALSRSRNASSQYSRSLFRIVIIFLHLPFFWPWLFVLVWQFCWKLWHSLYFFRFHRMFWDAIIYDLWTYYLFSHGAAF